ncbi:capsule assembly Wzi family protein, partial [bacterium]|nr:capsule assembly Wzi family protein [bacterium]
DRLVSYGLVKNIVVGHRPYSRTEIARMLVEADDNLEKLKNPSDKFAVTKIIKYWKNEYQFEYEQIKGQLEKKWQYKLVNEMKVDVSYLNHEKASYLPATGAIDSEIKTLTAYNGGRHNLDGYNYSLETNHLLTSPYLALYAQPRLQIEIGDNQENNKVLLHKGYVKTGVPYLEVEVGRDELAWGQGEFGGYMFTNNARPMDMVKVTNTKYFHFPWYLKYLGDFKYTFVYSNLGPEYDRKYSSMIAYKLSGKPASFAEYGFAYGVIMGGEGAPNMSMLDYTREVFGAMPQIAATGNAFSNKFGVVDARFRIPPAWGLELYGEMFMDDSKSDLRILFWDQAAFKTGIYLPRLGSLNDLGLRIEHKHSSPITYRHSGWASGYALNENIIGDPIGPDADGVYMDIYYDLTMRSRLTTRLAYERRRNDTQHHDGSPGGWVITNYLPSEDRYRVMLEFECPITKILDLNLTGGYEYAENFGFTDGLEKHLYLISAGLTFNIDRAIHH